MLRNIFFGLRDKKAPIQIIGAQKSASLLVNFDIVGHASLNALIVQHALNAVVGFKR